MKRSILIVLTLLLLLTACQTVPGPNDGTASSIPVATSPTTGTPATNPPALDETGYSFIYDGDAPFIGIDADYSGCTVGYLYWVDKASGEVALILAEPVLDSNPEGAYVYYVKKAEPATLYRTPIGEFSQHELMYDSSYGPIKALPPVPEEAGYSLSTAGRLYWVDRPSGDLTVVLEEPVLHHHVEGAYLYYVKKADPKKIYRTPIWEFSQHELIYECSWQIKALPLEPEITGYSFIYDGDEPFISIDADYSGCTVGHLYWVDEASGEVTLILAEPVLKSIQEGAYVYYVKPVEPTKIYRTRIWKFSQHEMIHETAHGKVCYMATYPGIENYLQFVADNKKFVVLELDTGEETVLMEQYYIEIAYMGPGDDGTLGNWIWFEGKLTGEERYKNYYYYDRDTGELWEDNSL